MSGGRRPGPICTTRGDTIDAGTMCLDASPLPGPLGLQTSGVASWEMSRKLLEAAQRTTQMLPAEMREQFAALFRPANIAITSGVLALWGISHLTGIGEIADLVLLLAGIVTIGWQVTQAAGDITDFVSIAVRAQSEADLDRAASHLARAVVTIGVATFIALIMRAGAKFRSARAARGAAPAMSLDASIAAEVRAILSSPEMAQLRAAHASGREIQLTIGGRWIQYEPNLPHSGFTFFEKNGFTLGRNAFSSEHELIQTLIHEIFRLRSSAIGRGVVPSTATSMQETISAETADAWAAAERIYRDFFSR